jgi:hypothetical protein
MTTDVYKIGGVGTDTLTNRVVKPIATRPGSLSTGTSKPFYFGGSVYVVPASTVYIPTMIWSCANSIYSNATANFYIAYADDSAMTTNVVPFAQVPIIVRGISTPLPIGGCVSVPSGKYIGFINPTAASSPSFCEQILGYEESV